MIKHNHFTDLLPYQKQQLGSPLWAGRWSFQHQTWEQRAFPPPSAGRRAGITQAPPTTLRTPRPDSRGPPLTSACSEPQQCWTQTLRLHSSFPFCRIHHPGHPGWKQTKLDQGWSGLCLQLPVRGREPILTVKVFKINPGDKRAEFQPTEPCWWENSGSGRSGARLTAQGPFLSLPEDMP